MIVATAVDVAADAGRDVVVRSRSVDVVVEVVGLLVVLGNCVAVGTAVTVVFVEVKFRVAAGVADVTVAETLTAVVDGSAEAAAVVVTASLVVVVTSTVVAVVVAFVARGVVNVAVGAEVATLAAAVVVLAEEDGANVVVVVVALIRGTAVVVTAEGRVVLVLLGARVAVTFGVGVVNVSNVLTPDDGSVGNVSRPSDHVVRGGRAVVVVLIVVDVGGRVVDDGGGDEAAASSFEV